MVLLSVGFSRRQVPRYENLTVLLRQIDLRATVLNGLPASPFFASAHVYWHHGESRRGDLDRQHRCRTVRDVVIFMVLLATATGAGDWELAQAILPICSLLRLLGVRSSGSEPVMSPTARGGGSTIIPWKR